MNVHFIAIGGAAMHNLALALHEKGYRVTGSDDNVFEPSKSRLAAKGLLPLQMGWNPSSITSDLDAVILGMHAKGDNPELARAKELGLKIYSYPEFLYEQTKDKTRVVIGGSHGKTSVTSMILFVLQELNMRFAYMVGAQIEGFDTMVGLDQQAPIAIFEGDEYLTSTLDPRPKFHLYKPHIAVLTGIAWDHINVFPTFENYLDQFSSFVGLIEPNGSLIYYQEDDHLCRMADHSRSDIHKVRYKAHPSKIENGKTILLAAGQEVPISVFGKHNLENIQSACCVCRALGISDFDFYRVIGGFKGSANRLQKIVEKEGCTVFKDFAHAPSKLKATVKAVREQYPNRRLIACMELHTYSSLNRDFLPQYKDSMLEADQAFVYFDPKVVELKRLPLFGKEEVQAAFSGDNLQVFDLVADMEEALKGCSLKDTSLLIMSSGNFGGIDFRQIIDSLIENGHE